MRIEIIKKPDFAKIAKNVRFGTAVGLTKTAKAAQAASIASINATFTVRGNWVRPSNKFGIRITAAKPDKLEAAVKTAADWLATHETGGERKPRSSSAFAVPTENIRRNKRQIIPEAQKPKGLKNTFVIETRKGPVLYQRVFANKAGKYTTRRLKKGLGSKIVPVYGLERTVKIKKNSTFYEPVKKTVDAELGKNIRREILNALATMR